MDTHRTAKKHCVLIADKLYTGGYIVLLGTTVCRQCNQSQSATMGK
ncbi:MULTISPECIES: hypothetical protein [Bacillus cereus group]|nr:hypothetical protein [Bacillus tropicus]